MPDQQQWFFPHPKPLEHRLGNAFFKSIPSVPGVYFLKDEEGHPLYVGQSRNLRQRLAAYKNANPNHTSKRILRLINQVRKIDWETQPSPQAAVVREEELIRTLKPRFNRAQVYPEAYQYIAIEIKRERVCIEESRLPPSSGHAFGAFKGAHRWALGALARLIFRIQTPEAQWWHIPRQWSQPLRKLSIQCPSGGTHGRVSIKASEIIDYFSGDSRRLIDHLLDASAALDELSPFDQDWILEDLHWIDAFFATGPELNKRLLDRAPQEGRLIPAAELNARILLARSTPSRST